MLSASQAKPTDQPPVDVSTKAGAVDGLDVDGPGPGGGINLDGLRRLPEQRPLTGWLGWRRRTLDRIDSWLTAALPLWLWTKLYRLGLRAVHRRGRHYITTHERPKFAADVQTWPDATAVPLNVAVVIQGPLYHPDDFTVQTVALYRRTFAGCLVVVSTWEGEDPATLERLRASGAEVLTSPKPRLAGLRNVNYQIVSTHAGVQHAARRGAQYILKTRTDQRLYAPGVAEFLVRLLASFPVAGGYRQTARIAVLNYFSLKYGPGFVSDMLCFGRTADMLTVWGVALDNGDRPPPAVGPHQTESLGDVCQRQLSPETYIWGQYLQAIGRPLREGVAEAWRILADHFVVVDHRMVDWYWPKYNPTTELHNTRYDGVWPYCELDFREWLCVYGGLADKLAVAGHYTAAVDLPPRTLMPDLMDLAQRPWPGPPTVASQPAQTTPPPAEAIPATPASPPIGDAF